MSLLVISEILGLFIYTLIANAKYSLRKSESLLQPSQMQLSKKQKKFLNFLPNLWNLHQIFNILQKK